MIRVPKVLLPSTAEGEASGDLPEPIVGTGLSKYWIQRSFSDADPDEEISPETIHFPSTLEASRSWETLKLPILCSICTDQKVDDTFNLDKLHWKYVHCTKCPDFFACGKCTKISSSAVLSKIASHRSHGKLITIQSRPFWAPIYDGSDLDQLQACMEAKSDTEFFLYFPWYFHCFQGMESVRLVYQKSLAQEAVAGMVFPAASQTERIDMITRFIHAPVDWNIRMFVTGNWQQFQKGLRPLIKERILIAKYSSRLNGLLERLRRFVEEKVQRHGPGDIACLPSARSIIPALADKEFLVYLMPLHMMTILNGEIDKRKMDEVLHSDYSNRLNSGSNQPVIQRTLVSAGDSGFARPGPGSHLSNLLRPETNRLWRMFEVIFKDNKTFKKLDRPLVVNDLTPWVEYASPEWRKLLERDAQIREKLYRVQYQNIETDVQYLHDPIGLPCSRSGPLEHYHEQRVLGNYEHATDGLIQLVILKRELGEAHIDIILEAQLTFLEQGYFERAAACMRYTSDPINLIGNSTTACIIVVSAYAGCFVRGNWDSALQIVSELFWRFCLLSDIANGPKNDLHELLNRVLIELVFHKLVLAVYRDIRRPCPCDAALVRLQSIQECLAKRSKDPFVVELLWQTVCLELDMRKRSIRDQYLEFESCFSMESFVHTPQEAIPVLNRTMSVLSGDDNVSNTIRGHASLLEATLLKEMRAKQAATDLAKQARSLYEKAGCEVGCLDVQLFGAEDSLSDIGPIYDKLRARNDLNRLRPLRKLAVQPTSSTDDGAARWGRTQRASLRDLAAEAGDNIAFHRWDMRKFATDTAVGAAVQAAEAVLQESVIHSIVLATLASFNLSKAYLTLGNYFSAALNSMLHLSLTNTQSNAEDQQRAILAVLDVFSAAVAADGRLQERLPRLGELWNGWLNDDTIWRWDGGSLRCDEIERFIDGACFLPLLAGRVEREPENGIFSHNVAFEETLFNHLRIAFDLYSSLPPYTAAAIVPRLSRALGSTAAYVGNLELAIRCFWQGIQCCHSKDKHSTECLRIDAAKLMVELGERDPEHWLHVVSPGRSLLAAAPAGLWQTYMSGTMFKGMEANLHLLKSLVGEARAWKKVFDWELNSEAGRADVKKLERVTQLFKKTQQPRFHNELVFDRIADRVNISSPFELNYNLVTLAENTIFRQTRQFALEMGLICSDCEQMIGMQRGTNLWRLVQEFKGTVLGYRFSRLVPGQLLESIKSNSEAWRLYQEEKALIDEGPQYLSDKRLERHRLKMSLCPELQALMRRRLGRAVTMSELTSLAKETVKSSKNVIMVDWILYWDHFLLVGYNASVGKLCMTHLIKEISVPELELWIERHLCVPGEMLVDTLKSMQELESLFSLTKAIHVNCSPGDILIFSPSLCLNRIPLHAIPYAHEKDHPIIHYHPIVYAPSNVVLKECVERALSMDATSQLQTKLFDCYGEDRASSTGSIEDLATILRRRGASITASLGKDINSEVVKEALPQADILHFHGHIDGQDLEKHLVLDVEYSDNNTPSNQSRNNRQNAATNSDPIPRSSATKGDEGQSAISNSFSLQDVYATKLRARLVVLMGCGSSELIVSRGDDALGLVNGFLAAGATSVVGTQWPLGTDDAWEFSRYFYQNVFDQAIESERRSATAAGLGDLATPMHAAVQSMRACKKPACQRKQLKDRLVCHRVAPYRWAPFVAWGSWVFQEQNPLS